MHSLDNKNGTALHWACFLGYEISVNFLCSLNSQNLDLQDIEGLTPLHLGVVSGNSRVVRKLLIKGSIVDIMDKNNKKALDVAKEN